MSIHSVAEPRLPPPVPPSADAKPPAASAPPSQPEQLSAFGRLLRGLGTEVQRGETLVHHAIASASGGDLDPAQLIALQAGVYRYAEAVDLASRLVDHATAGLKTVIQGT
jgi:hypothetical protein